MGAAVVTGAGRGLGLELARALAGRGLAVNVTDVDAAAAESAAAAIGGSAWGSTARRPRRRGLPGNGARSRATGGLARRLGQQRRRARHRPRLGARRGAAPDAVRGQHAGDDQRHARRARADAARRARARDQRGLARRARRTAGRGALRGDQARRDRVQPRGARRPAPFGLAADLDLGRLPGRDLDADAPRQARRPRRGALVLGRPAARRGRRRASGRACSTARAPCSRFRAGAAASCACSTRSPGWRYGSLPLWMRDAQRRQRRWKKRIEGGRGP